MTEKKKTKKSEKIEKGSKELNDILIAIHKWMEKYGGLVDFVGSFNAYQGKDFEVVDDRLRLIAFGLRDNLRLSLKEMDGMLENEKEKFVNW